MTNWDPRKLINWLNEKKFKLGDGTSSGLVAYTSTSATLRLYSYGFKSERIVMDDLMFDYPSNTVTIKRIRYVDAPIQDMKIRIRNGNRTPTTVNVHWIAGEKGIVVSIKFFADIRKVQKTSSVAISVWELPIPLFDYIGDTAHSAILVGEKITEAGQKRREKRLRSDEPPPHESYVPHIPSYEPSPKRYRDDVSEYEPSSKRYRLNESSRRYYDDVPEYVPISSNDPRRHGYFANVDRH